MKSSIKFSYLSFTLLALIFLGMAILLSYTKIINRGTTIVYSDYGDFYQSLQFEHKGKSLYSPAYFKPITPSKDIPDLNHLGSNLNPPFFSLLIYPLGYLTFSHSFLLWSIFSIACGIISIIILQKTLAIPLSFNFTLMLLLGFFIALPTLICLVYGQTSLYIFLLLVTSWHYLRNNQTVLAAVILAVAASLKPFLALFFLYFLIRKHWRALFYFCSTGLICALIALLFFGQKSYLDYLSIIKTVYWYSCTFNASILGVLVRIFGGEEKNVPLIHFPILTHWLYWIFSILFIAYACKFISIKNQTEPVKKIDLDFSLLIIIALLISPLGWLYYFMWLMIPIMVIHQYSKNSPYMIRTSVLLCITVLFSTAVSGNLSAAEVIPFCKSWNCSFLYHFSLLLLVYLINFTARHISCEQSLNSKNTLSSSLLTMMYASMLLPSFLEVLYETRLTFYSAVFFTPS